jgi:hypothetical protein
MQQVIPQACAQFHDALDRLEDELSRAKVIMRRDFAVYQAIRTKRLAEEAAENERLTAIKSATDTILTANESEAAKNATLQAAENGGDTEMQDVSQVVKPVEKTTVGKINSAGSISESQTKSLEAGGEPPSTKDAAKINGDGFKPSIAAHTVPPITPAKSPSATGEFQDLDFDSMFEDLTGDAGNDNIATANKSVDLTSFSDANADDVSSLLPGLENFANIPEPAPVESNNVTSNLDLSVLDVPDQGSSTEQKPKEGEKTEPQSQESADLGDFTGDSTFDDLFNYEFEMDGAGDREGGNNDGSEFEDAWMSGFGND